jgi:hypothetical protein
VPNNALPRLLEIYSRLKVSKVPDDAAYKALIAEAAAEDPSDPIFFETVERVDSIKSMLEELVGIQVSKKKQVEWALRTLRNWTNVDERNICEVLINRVYFPHWENAQQAFYRDATDPKKESYDYFLSFTQRNPNDKPGSPGEKAGNPVNSAHHYLIRSHGLPDPTDSPRNEFAHLMHQLLKNSNSKFNGYYYPTREGESAAVIPKLMEACRNSAVFVQVIQNEMFSKAYAGKDNFCFDEFRQAIAAKKPTIYIFADGTHPKDLIPPVDTLGTVYKWHKVIREGGVVNIQFTRTSAESGYISPNNAVISEKVIEQVGVLRNAMFNDIPADTI